MTRLLRALLLAALTAPCSCSPTIDWDHCNRIPGPDGKIPDCVHQVFTL